MGQQNSVEDRLERLERELVELRRRVDTGGAAAGSKHPLEELVGSQPDPEFLEVLRLGREARAADRPADDGEGNA
jgi:hypothetical protein